MDAEVEGLVFIDYDGDEMMYKYRVVGVIGSGVDGTTVYKAEWEDSWKGSGMVAMRYAKASDRVAFGRLQAQVEEHDSLTSRAHLLHHFRPFHYQEYYCVPFGSMKHGSLLTLMAERFPRGLPEACIIHLLYRLVKVLRGLQLSNVTHLQMSAAHVYVVQLPDGLIDIYVGYGATLHNLAVDEDDRSRRFLPASSTCRWAAAPELYAQTLDHGHLSSTRYCKADVWLLGITALELAYGGLNLCTRGDLESLINTLHRRKRLPSNLEHDEHRRWLREKRAFHFLPSSLTTNRRRPPTRFQFTRPKERLFSKPFLNFLIDCLHFHPAKRPHLFQLLQYRLFHKPRDTCLFDLSPYYNHAQWLIQKNISSEDALLFDKAVTVSSRTLYTSQMDQNSRLLP